MGMMVVGLMVAFIVTATVNAQDNGEPSDSIEWGSISAVSPPPSDDWASNGMEEPPNPPTLNKDGSPQGPAGGSSNPTRSAATAAQIESAIYPHYGLILVRISATDWSNAATDPIAHYEVRRAHVHSNGEISDYQMLGTQTQGSTVPVVFSDRDVASRVTYKYKVTPITQSGRRLTDEFDTHRSTSRRFVEAVGEDSRHVRLFLRPHPDIPIARALVDIYEYEYDAVTETFASHYLRSTSHKFSEIKNAHGEGEVGFNHSPGRMYGYHVIYHKLGQGETELGSSSVTVTKSYPVPARAGAHTPSQVRNPAVVDQIVQVHEESTIRIQHVDKRANRVSWNAPSDNYRSVAHYEILRESPYLPGKEPSKVVGTTKRLYFTDQEGSAGKYYNYSVRPMTVQGQRIADSQSVAIFHPTMTATCNSTRGDDHVVERIHVEHNILAPDHGPAKHPLSFDLWMYGTDATLDNPVRCVDIKPQEYVVNKELYYEHKLDADCRPPTSACDVSAQTPGSGTVSAVDDWKIEYGGLPRYSFARVEDTSGVEAAGIYGYQYQICTRAQTSNGKPLLCSMWLPMGTQYFGVTTKDFGASDVSEPWTTAVPLLPTENPPYVWPY